MVSGTWLAFRVSLSDCQSKELDSSFAMCGNIASYLINVRGIHTPNILAMVFPMRSLLIFSVPHSLVMM